MFFFDGELAAASSGSEYSLPWDRVELPSGLFVHSIGDAVVSKIKIHEVGKKLIT